MRKILIGLFSLMVLHAAISVVCGQVFDPSQASLSHDGKRVVYVTTNRGNELWVINVDGSGQNNLWEASGATWPRFSPDGKRIVFSRKIADDIYYDIWIINSDGTGLKQLTKTPTIHELQPDFTRAGNEIVFARPELFKGSAGVLMSLQTGQEAVFLPNNLKVTQIFPIDENKIFVSCSCESKAPKFLLKENSIGGRVFQLASTGKASVVEISTLGTLDTVDMFRSDRSCKRQIFELSHKGISTDVLGREAPITSEIVIVDGGNTQSLATWGEIGSFDIALDGSKMIVSGRRLSKAPSKLWLYDFNTKAWSEIKPVKSPSGSTTKK